MVLANLPHHQLPLRPAHAQVHATEAAPDYTFVIACTSFPNHPTVGTYVMDHVYKEGLNCITDCDIHALQQ